MSPDESGRAWHWLCVVARASGDAVAELTAAAGRSVFDEPPQPARATAVTASPAADHREIEVREVTGG
jgi:hypothetical protein